jgi:hypothetical protein
MPSKDSSYKKVFIKEHKPIERTPASLSLAVIIEILEPAKKNRVDVRDAAMIKFASDLVQKRIMNEGWGPTEKRVETMLFNQLPPLGEPARKGGRLYCMDCGIAAITRTKKVRRVSPAGSFFACHVPEAYHLFESVCVF